MPFEMSREDFITKAGYTEEDWVRSALSWEQLLRIAKHHDAALQTLALHGGTIANRMQAFTGVHSVRWRIKDTYGLLKKILRKNLEEPRKAKWEDINSENYRSIVSDLIGVRALHLLKEDCIEIDEQIRKTWNVHEITIFKRDGDSKISEIIDRGAAEELHHAGYRSIHYGLSYQPEKEPILVEVQVRTIFQEAWSEIDHKVRYPDFSDNELLKYFLSVFNGLSGTADDMGSFVIKLDSLIGSHSAAILENEIALQARDADIEKMQIEINNLRTEGTASLSSIESLQTSVDKIKDIEVVNRKNARLSKALSMATTSYLTEEQLKSVATFFKPDPNVMTAIKNFSAQHSAFSESIADIPRPNAALMEAVKQLTQPSAAIAAALENAVRPNAALAVTMDQEQLVQKAALALANLSKSSNDIDDDGSTLG